MDKNYIGDRGETFFKIGITTDNIFRVYFLGEKAPVIDFLAEINDDETPFQCLIQVKATNQGFKEEYPHNLRCVVLHEKMEELIKRPLPTYIAGVDINNGKVYICPAFSNPEAYVSSIPVTHLLSMDEYDATMETLSLLKQDVINYWVGINYSQSKNQFVSGSFVYLRDLSQSYKLREQDKAKDYKKRFYQLFNGISQDHYPKDELDDIILDAIQSIAREVNVKNNLIVTDTELRNFAIKFNQLNNITAHINFLLDLDYSSINEANRKFINDLMPTSLPISLFAMTDTSLKTIVNMPLDYRLNIDIFVTTVQSINNLRQTYHLATEFL